MNINGIELSEAASGNVRIEVFYDGNSRSTTKILIPEDALKLARELERLARQCL